MKISDVRQRAIGKHLFINGKYVGRVAHVYVRCDYRFIAYDEKTEIGVDEWMYYNTLQMERLLSGKMVRQRLYGGNEKIRTYELRGRKQ